VFKRINLTRCDFSCRNFNGSLIKTQWETF